ncbi:MAG: minor capsid protein [Ruminiclostridium sp.]|nr:minor capsid protein [Ruminiclostridium sp.]
MKKTSIKNRNAAYWERRVAQRMVDYMAEAEKTASDLGQAYYAAGESMKDDMHRIFGNFQRAFEIPEAEAKRIFASVGNDSAMKTLRAAAGKIADPEQRQLALDALTSAPAYTWRIARLDDMLGNVSQTCNRLYKTDLKKTTDFLGEIAGTAYNRTVYDLQVGTGTVGAAFDLLPESRINQILKTNWSGKNYSARIYADVKDMEGKLKQTLLESMFTGESEHKIAERVAERWQIGYNDARRLIRTETNYVANQAELESYRSAGVKEYTFTAVLDSRTSEICAELDGKRFPVDRAKVGVNLPPMHPYCRSTTIAVIEDDIWGMSDEEIDKLMNEIDEELGLNEDISFDEWLNGLKETEDGKVRYAGTQKNAAEMVDKSAGSGIIELNKD